MEMLWTCYGEVASFLRTWYGETGVMDFDLKYTQLWKAIEIIVNKKTPLFLRRLFIFLMPTNRQNTRCFCRCTTTQVNNKLN